MKPGTVRVWEEPVSIPTYKVAAPEKSPLFLENRAYQGSTGKVYPLPVTEKIYDTKEDVTYTAVCLENDYLYVMVLPQLGGRIQRALDKTNRYDFVYYNQVIKPALVGLTGPWISGGIEFNWPQHHRPTTDQPVDYSFTQNEDGSATIYVSEIDRMYGTKGMASFTLYPDKAYIEIKGQLYNPTDLPQTFLWWANPAVPVNQNTYSVFPPDVHAVMDHGKRAVSTFPIATGEYYKYDYSEGIDISCYRNVAVPTSYMAAHSDYDFIGNYDEQLNAGLLHVADHHISPGKKQWTWGNSDFGQAWDRNLTDEDGPYIELMTGVFADNQPDFTWLKPYEEKTFTQYFMPYKQVGRVKNATQNAAVALEAVDSTGTIRLYATGTYENASVTVTRGDTILFSDTVSLSPVLPYEASFYLEGSLIGCTVSVRDAKEKLLVSYTEKEDPLEPTPLPAEVLPAPEQIHTTEELYLAGEHLEQYRHATYHPEDYYLEGLKRDPFDIRLNRNYGLLLYRRGRIRESIACFEKAIERQTMLTPNPYSGECFFYLGMARYMNGEKDLAFDAFYKSTWSAETQSSGFFWLSILSAQKKNYEDALAFIDQSLYRNWHNMKARTVKAAILRSLGRSNDKYLQECLDIDPLYMGILFEQGLQKNDLTGWKKAMRKPVHNYLTLALDYIKSGFYEDAVTILDACETVSPLIFYYKGYALAQMGEEAKALQAYEEAEAADPAYCFPNKTEDHLILTAAAKVLRKASHTNYYLGCLLYDKRRYEEAIACWEASVVQNPYFAPAFRNLAIGYYNKEQDMEKALQAMKTAFELEPEYSRNLQEYDQLCSKAGFSLNERLSLLEMHFDLVKDRDVLYLEYITLLNNTGRFQEALDAIRSHRFHPWEGGEGRVSTQYRYALTQLGLKALQEKKIDEAIRCFTQTKFFPENLGEGKLPNVMDTIADYYLGCTCEAANDTEGAKHYFELASTGLSEPSGVLYYNDQPSDTIFYQGLANDKLGNIKAARKCYHQLLTYGRTHIFDQVSYDYFAVSLPEIEIFPSSIQTRNDLYCHYLMGLGHLGLGNKAEAEKEFALILKQAPDYQGAITHVRFQFL